MDFFGAQQQARSTTRRLVLWFGLAVVGLIGVIYLAVAVGLRIASEEAEPLSLWNPTLLTMTAIAVGGLILAGSLYKLIRLSRDGGARIALELGGRPVARSTSDLRERRLINVVEEMAIASGIPAPPVYVLDAEGGINAFAAGARPNEAVVAVTRGALERLSRDELQGVIAHEFSHVLNGDMRLNLRLVAVLHGILLLTLAGRTLLRGARGRDGAPFAVAGAALLVTGYVGVLCGKLIKAGVSRQREFLADASAVQFTRNPDGIAGALSRIAEIGSTVQHPQAEEASHMFFGSGAKLSSLLATHPPLDERIRRIDPAWKVRQRIARTHGKPAADVAETETSTALSGFVPSAIADRIGTVTPDDLAQSRALIAAFPPALKEALHGPRGARAIVFALLTSHEGGLRDRQLDVIASRYGIEARDECSQFAALIAVQGDGRRLPLLDLALPALTEFPTEARDEILDVAHRLIAADGRTSTFEYVALRLLRSVLRPQRAGGSLPRPSASTLRADLARVLSLLARAGHDPGEAAESAFAAACERAPLDGLVFEADTRSMAAFDDALARLATTTPQFRRGVIAACASAVLHDRKVSPSELELLRAICQALDAPLPLLEPADLETQ